MKPKNNIVPLGKFKRVDKKEVRVAIYISQDEAEKDTAEMARLDMNSFSQLYRHYRNFYFGAK